MGKVAEQWQFAEDGTTSQTISETSLWTTMTVSVRESLWGLQHQTGIRGSRRVLTMGGERGMSPLGWEAEGLLASLSAGPTTSWASQGPVSEGPSKRSQSQQKLP